MSFFTARDFQITNPAALGTGCGKCSLYRHCKSPKMKPYGAGNQGIMIIGESPSKKDDEMGTPFIGTSGAFLNKHLRELGIDPVNGIVKLNAVNCRPPDNRDPTSIEVESCRGRVWTAIEKYKPKVIIPVGVKALESLIGHRWPKRKDEKEVGLGAMARWFNWAIPDRQTKCWIVPNFHPAYILREMEDKPAAELWFRKALKNAVKHARMPLPTFKDEESCVEVITDAEKLRKRLIDISFKEDLIVIDYETSGLKPYRNGHRIWYIGIAVNENEAISFPTNISKEALRVYRAIMTRSACKKIAHNMTYEDLWTRERLGVQIEGWVMDTIQAAHVLDQRPGITGLKFQMYVRTGLIDYSSHIAQYLSSPLNKKEAEMGDNAFNQISLAPPEPIMKYCGVDCIGTYRLALDVANELNIDLLRSV